MPARSPELRNKIAAVGGGAKRRRPDFFAQRAKLIVAPVGQYVARLVVVPPPLSEAQRRQIAQVWDTFPALPEQRGGEVA